MGLGLALAWVACGGLQAWAQGSPASGVDVMDRESRRERPGPLSAPRPPSAPSAPSASAPALEESFVLASLRVEGATAFGSDELVAPYAPLLGQRVTAGEIQGIASEMSAKYRAAGFILSRVVLPTQEADPLGAEITLLAVEGYLDEIAWEGDPATLSKAQAYFAKLEAELLALRPFRLGPLERALTLANEGSGLRVSSTFQKSETPNAASLLIGVKRVEAEGSLSFANSGTESTGPWMASGSFSFAGFPQIGDRFVLGYVQAWDWREYYSLSFSLRRQWVGGFALSFAYAYSESQRPGNIFAKLFDHATASHSFELAANYPIIRGRALNLSLGLSYAHRDSQAELLGAPFTRDRVRALTLGVNFDFADEWGGVTQIYPSATFGLDAFGATDRDWESSSPLAPASYKRANLYVSSRRRLPWGFDVAVAGEIQLAGTVLPSYELFSLGGGRFGRGYDPGTLESDNGAAVSAELRRPFRSSETTGFSPYAFYDVGGVWPKGQSAGEDPHEELASAGVGLTFFYFPESGSSVSVNTFVAKPLKTASRDNASPRWFLSASFAF